MWRATVGAIVGACLLAASGVGAVPWGRAALDVALGEGVVAHRFPRGGRGGYGARPTASGWRAEGFTLPPGAATSVLFAFAANARGRIFAAFDRGMLYTDDRGRNWQTATWDGPQVALALAFDPATGLGVAVGTRGAVWVTRDDGVAWSQRRVGDAALLDVALLDETVVWITAGGLAQVSDDLGLTARTVAASPPPGPPPTLTAGPDAAWIMLDGAAGWRVRPGGLVDPLEASGTLPTARR